MEFRPCIDIHNGKVKQIVGSTLTDEGDYAKENFVSEHDAGYYAQVYKEYNLKGGHVILLNAKDSPYYAKTYEQALIALDTYRNGLMVGGGVNDENAGDLIDAGASHVIVTSFVFRDGAINMDNLKKLDRRVGRENIVLDLSCRKREGKYYVVTDRWQKFTNVELTTELFDELAQYSDEFLVHAVDIEGKSSGMDEKVIAHLAQINHTITYAGGISSYDDVKRLRVLGNDRVNFTVGSKLDLFGGNLTIGGILECIQ